MIPTPDLRRWGQYLLLAAFASACSDSGADPQPITLTSIKSDILVTSCSLSVSCHAGSSSASHLDLKNDVWEHLVNVESTVAPGTMLVVPGSPQQSFLFQKLTEPTPAAGERMPLRQPPLSQANIDRIRLWIEAGAPND